MNDSFFLILANGFLPTRGSFMLDTIFVSMFVIVALMSLSIYLVRVRKQYILHRNIQIGLASLLGLIIIAFEIDVRFFTDWRNLAAPSPYFETGVVYYSLLIHLIFAIPCPLVWGVVIWRGLRKFPRGLQPGEHSPEHRFWGRVAAVLMLITAITGCTFYWLAFVAT